MPYYSRLRRRRYRTAAGFRRASAFGLGTTRFLSTVKFPYATMNFAANSNISSVFRFFPWYSTSGIPGLNFAFSLPAMDPEAKKMFGVYKYVRIVNYYLSITSGFASSNADMGTTSFAGRVIRNCAAATPATVFMDGVRMVTPGIIWKRSSDTDRCIQFNISVRPRGALERQWLPTTLDGNNLSAIVAGNATNFAPAVDVVCFRSKTSGSQVAVPVTIWVRTTLEFRYSEDPSSESKIIDVDQYSLTSLENAVKNKRAQLQHWQSTDGPGGADFVFDSDYTPAKKVKIEEIMDESEERGKDDELVSETK